MYSRSTPSMSTFSPPMSRVRRTRPFFMDRSYLSAAPEPATVRVSNPSPPLTTISRAVPRASSSARRVSESSSGPPCGTPACAAPGAAAAHSASAPAMAYVFVFVRMGGQTTRRGGLFPHGLELPREAGTAAREPAHDGPDRDAERPRRVPIAHPGHVDGGHRLALLDGQAADERVQLARA